MKLAAAERELAKMEATASCLYSSEESSPLPGPERGD